MNTILKRLVSALPFGSLLSRSGQADTDITGKRIGHGAYAITLPSEFQKVGQLSVNIPLNTEVSGRFPRSSMHSKIYTDGETILFVQRMSAPAANSYFKLLDGEKENRWGKDWHKNSYSMDVANTTKEFDKYNNFIKEKGLQENLNYLVEMYDSLASRSSVIRVLAFTPHEAEGFPAVPKSIARYYVETNN